MNMRYLSALGVLPICTFFAPGASAQISVYGQENFAASHETKPRTSAGLRGRSDFSNMGREWVAELEQSGIVNRSLRGPYRVALPLVALGHRGPTVMLTYARRLPGTAQAKGVLLFVNIPLE